MGDTPFVHHVPYRADTRLCPVQGYLSYKKPPPNRRPMPRVLGGSWGGGRFLMSEVPLYTPQHPADAGVAGGAMVWGYNPVCSHSGHPTRGCIPRYNPV